MGLFEELYFLRHENLKNSNIKVALHLELQRPVVATLDNMFVVDACLHYIVPTL